MFSKSRTVYNKLGRYKHTPDITTTLSEETGVEKNGYKYIYWGQFKEGSNTWHGAGIIVWIHGHIVN